MKSYSKSLCSIAASLLVPEIAYGVEFVVSPAIERKIKTALSIAAEKPRPENPAAFRAALKVVASASTAKLVRAASKEEGSNISAKVVVLANALNLDSSRLEEIEKFYITDGIKNSMRDFGSKDGKFSPIVFFSPALPGQYAKAEYRSAWEFFMLCAAVFGPTENFHERVQEALIRIGDPRSVPVIEHRYKTDALDPHSKPAPWNWLLLQFPSETALRALFECMEEWEKRSDERKAAANLVNFSDGDRDWNTDPTEQIKQLLMLVPTKADKWKEIVAKAKGANTAQTAVLEKMRAALEAN